MRTPLENVSLFKERRRRVIEGLRGSAMIIAAHPEKIRNHDVGFAYRQDSNFYYLTGFEEPGALLLIRPGQTPETVMFVRPKDRERETWDGFRFGPEGAEKSFGIDKAYPVAEFAQVAPQLLKGFDSLYYRIRKNFDADHLVLGALDTLKGLQGRTGYGFLTIHDADTFLGEYRLIKSEVEMVNLRQACEISAQAHLAAMKFTKPGVNERQVQAVLGHHFYSHGAAREGYNYIVAAGNSATTLHYNFNDQPCNAGDLLLIDAGAEYNYYTGDITRTFPISGKFSHAQAEIYAGVLKVQKQIIEFIKPGIFFSDLHQMGASLLTDVLLDLGFFNGRKQDILDAQLHKKFYPHGIGHWLGMDVHDAGLYFFKGQARPIEENMCFTIEPGLYIPMDEDSAPAKYRGIGVRIEDNLRVTRQGCEILTSTAPKEINELEKIIGTA